MMDACISSGVFSGEVSFTGSEAGGLGKRCDNSKSRAQLGGWAPVHSSFRDFMVAGGRDFYSSSGLF
jgi:hypothetical protein